ncbi:MAG TPA: phosphatase PAP2 family protein [Kofleriaceae bacterium]|nr:phosphatase PAP2 family protein [Kofleriaceae bacterium]
MKASCLVALALVLAARAARADDTSGPAYQLQAEVDVPVIAIATLATGAWFLDDLGPAWCAPRCDPSQLDALDRPFAGRYVPAWTTAGTITAVALLAAPPIILLATEGSRHAANDTIVLAEAVLCASGLGAVAQTAVRRPRPFLYGTAAPLSDREDTNASFSFFSGHTALSFAATVGTWRTLERLHAGRWRYLVLGVGLAGSAFVGVSRVVSGDHFPTDVIAGAGIGASLGALVPALHRHGVHVTPTGVVVVF